MASSQADEPSSSRRGAGGWIASLFAVACVLLLAVAVGPSRAQTQPAAPSPAQRVPLGPVAPLPEPLGGPFALPLGGTPNIEASISYDMVWANNFTSFGSVNFTIRQSPGGAILATGTKSADIGGNVQFNRWQDHNVDLMAGMQITATDGATTKVLTLVPVSVTTVSTTTNVVTGTAAGLSPVHVDVGGGMSWTGLDTTADGSGHWSVDFSPSHITADMQAIAKVSDPDGDVTSYGKQPPRIDASLSQDGITAHGFTPNGNVTVTIRQSPGGTQLA